MRLIPLIVSGGALALSTPALAQTACGQHGPNFSAYYGRPIGPWITYAGTPTTAATIGSPPHTRVRTWVDSVDNTATITIRTDMSNIITQIAMSTNWLNAHECPVYVYSGCPFYSDDT